MRRQDSGPRSERDGPGRPARGSMESNRLPGGRYDEGSPSAQPAGFGDYEGERPGAAAGDTASPYEGGTWRGESQRGRGPKNHTRSDERIREDLSERLSDDPWIDASDIEVAVKDGIVTLTGTVEARHLKHRAEDIAGYCGGVTDVQNRLKVASR